MLRERLGMIESDGINMNRIDQILLQLLTLEGLRGVQRLNVD
jgi:hypothetical protein